MLVVSIICEIPEYLEWRSSRYNVSQIFDNYTAAYEQLIDAYSQMAQHLPRFDRLSDAFSDQPEFQFILADVYSDIVKFHLQVYKIVRRSGKHTIQIAVRD